MIDGDTVTSTNSSTFNNKNADSGKTVTVNSITLNDTNYSISSGQTTTADITAKALSATALAENKTYDGNTTANVTLTSITGLIGAETLNYIVGATFDDKDAGTNKIVNINSIALQNGNNGGLATNYSFALGKEKTKANITRKSLTAIATAENKEYDSRTTANVTLSSVSGLIDSETLNYQVVANFSDKNEGVAKIVKVDSVILSNGSNGGLAKNYIFTSGQTTSATIDKKQITITGISAANKVYDGTTIAQVNTSKAKGWIAGDAVIVSASGEFLDDIIENAKTVVLTSTYGGGDARNYIINDQLVTLANITDIPTANTNDDKFKNKSVVQNMIQAQNASIYKVVTLRPAFLMPKPPITRVAPAVQVGPKPVIAQPNTQPAVQPNNQRPATQTNANLLSQPQPNNQPAPVETRIEPKPVIAQPNTQPAVQPNNQRPATQTNANLLSQPQPNNQPAPVETRIEPKTFDAIKPPAKNSQALSDLIADIRTNNRAEPKNNNQVDNKPEAQSNSNATNNTTPSQAASGSTQSETRSDEEEN